MAGGLPRELAALLEATDADDRDHTWSAFLDGYSDPILKVARRLCLDYSRERYGRHRSGEARDTGEQRALRRRLSDLAGMELMAERLAAPDARAPDRRLRERELTAALDAALAELPPRDRPLLQLRYEDDRSVREVAEVMGFPSVFHVYRRLKEVLEKLRQRLRASGVEESGP